MCVYACMYVYTYIHTQSYICPDYTNHGAWFSVHAKVSFVHFWYLSVYFTKHWDKKKFN